jgi:tRNA(Ile)-lysidine synthase
VLTSLQAEHGSSIVTSLPDDLFSSIDFTHGALVAISGGGDSTALLLLLKRHLDRKAPTAPFIAVTVDHDLRPDSAAEAKAVARLCTEHGIPHKTLVWNGAKPSTGVPAAARETRYRLLAEAAKDAGIGMVVTGHTADDQAETVSMRQSRTQAADPPHERGLAGMAPATLYDWSVWIVRPLLGTRRETLREFLRREGVGWIEDPTNIDEHFERPRIRAALHKGHAAHQFADSMAAATSAATMRETMSRHAATLIRDFASQPAPGLVRLDPAFAGGDRHAAVTAMRMLLATVGGTSFPPDEARTAALFGRLGTPGLCATLSRTMIDVRRAGIFLRREQRDLPAASIAIDGMVWDGRRRINFRDEGGGLLIEPLGPRAAAERTIPENGVPDSLLRAANAAEPTFRHDPERTALSPRKPLDAEVLPLVAPFARFLPSFDLDLAAALADLVGAPALPMPPLTGLRRGRQAGKV